MSGILLLAVFSFLAGVCLSQDTNPRFVPEPAPEGYFMQTGALDTPFNLKCELDADAGFLVQKQLRIVHRSAKTGNERTISEQGSLIHPFDEMPDVFTLEFVYLPNVYATLTISAISDDMDGEFICQVKPINDDQILESATTSLTVVAGVDMLEMTVGDRIVDAMDQNVEFRVGMVEVTCKVSGTNPEPIISLTLGGAPLDVGAMQAILDPDSTFERRSYSGSVMYQLDFTHTMFGKKLQCHAETQMPEGQTMELASKDVSTTLNGIVDDPRVSCTNNTAGVNDRQVTLKCVVSKAPIMKSYYFRIRDNMLYPGNKTSSLTEVYTQDFNETHTAYVLKFYKMENWHFTEDIYFQIQGYDGNVYQYIVYLIKDPVGAASMLMSALVLPVTCLVLLVRSLV